MAYQRPMVTVDQNMTVTPTSIERPQPAFVFGPNYELHRFENADEKAATFAKLYTGSALELPYPKVIDDAAVDKQYTKLFGDNVIVKLADFGPATLAEKDVNKTFRDINGGYTKLFFPNQVLVDRDINGEPVDRSSFIVNGSDDPVKLPENLSVGDTLLVSYSETSSAVVEPIVAQVVDVQYSDEGFDIDNLDSDSSSIDVAGAGTLVTINTAIPETVDPDSVEASLVRVMQGVEFSRKDLFAQKGWQWEQPDTKMEDLVSGKKFYGVKVNYLRTEIIDYWQDDIFCDVLLADLYITYRELLTNYADTFHNVNASSSVAAMLGTVDPDNPLAMGVYMATLNAATDDGDEAPPVYFMAVPSDDEDGYDAVLRKATLTDKAYVFAPVTRDDAIIDKVRRHVLSMSTKTEKMWRIAIVSTKVPDTVDRLSALDDPQGDEFLAIPISPNGGMAVDLPNYNILRIVKGVDDIAGNPDTHLRAKVVPGDKVRFGYYTDDWGEIQYDTYIVDKVVNNYTITLVDPDDDESTTVINVDHLKHADNTHYTPSKIEIFHPYTAQEQADEIAHVSRQLMSRRMYNVFPSVFSNNGVTMTGEFAACGVAGLISATEPQQPITNVTVRGIDNIPLVYSAYSKSDLDTMAAGGTFIIMQDMPNDLVYVRHQISTAASDGNLNTAELSVTKNVDSISYAFAELFRPYYGKYNIVPGLLAILENLAKKLISQLSSDTSVYGPQLIIDQTVVKYVRQNELMKDHVDIGITLGVPYPCNNIDIVLTV